MSFCWLPASVARFNPRRDRQHSFVESDHEIFSTVILSLPLLQEGQLSVSGERMCKILVNHLEDQVCPVNVWLGKLTALNMTPLGWLGRKTSTQTNILLIKDSLQQQTHLNGNIFGNKQQTYFNGNIFGNKCCCVRRVHCTTFKQVSFLQFDPKSQISGESWFFHSTSRPCWDRHLTLPCL